MEERKHNSGLFPLAAQLPYTAHATCPQLGKAFLCQLKWPTGTATAQSNGGSFSIEVPFLPEMSTAKISHHTSLLAILKYIIFVNSDYSVV